MTSSITKLSLFFLRDSLLFLLTKMLLSPTNSSFPISFRKAYFPVLLVVLTILSLNFSLFLLSDHLLFLVKLDRGVIFDDCSGLSLYSVWIRSVVVISKREFYSSIISQFGILARSFEFSFSLVGVILSSGITWLC